jgi:hypothetical protein
VEVGRGVAVESAEKLAITSLSLSMVISIELPVPDTSPDQASNPYPLAAMAFRTTLEPAV